MGREDAAAAMGREDAAAAMGRPVPRKLLRDSSVSTMSVSFCEGVGREQTIVAEAANAAEAAAAPGWSNTACSRIKICVDAINPQREHMIGDFLASGPFSSSPSAENPRFIEQGKFDCEKETNKKKTWNIPYKNILHWFSP
jgi:hypothetical protein